MDKSYFFKSLSTVEQIPESTFLNNSVTNELKCMALANPHRLSVGSTPLL